jgi:hypothetical protein
MNNTERLKILQQKIMVVRPFKNYPLTDLYETSLLLEFYSNTEFENAIVIKLKCKKNDIKYK